MMMINGKTFEKDRVRCMSTIEIGNDVTSRSRSRRDENMHRYDILVTTC